MKPPEQEKATLEACLRELHLPTIRECFEELARQAEQETLDYEQFLLTLVQRECQVRRQHRLERCLRESRLPAEKNLAGFDLKRLPAKVTRQVRTLLEGRLRGSPGERIGLRQRRRWQDAPFVRVAQELIRQGRKVYFSTCSRLVQDLLAAKRDLKLSRLIQKLGRYEAVLIDDLGYVQQSREEMEVLFTLLAERYERGSVMITSNLPFSKWEAIFKDPMTTAAAIDRLVHHCVILELNVPSYRIEQAKKNRPDATDPSPE